MGMASRGRVAGPSWRTGLDASRLPMHGPRMGARCWVGALAATVILCGCHRSHGEPRLTRAAGLGAGALRIECTFLDDCHETAARRCGEYVVLDGAEGRDAVAEARTGAAASAPGSEAEIVDASSHARGQILLVRCGHPDRSVGFHQQHAPGARWPAVTP